MALGPKAGGTPDPAEKKKLSDEAFMREVDDAVRAGDLENFWTRYGRWLLLLIIAILGAAAFYLLYYVPQQQEAKDKQGEAFVEAIDRLEADDEAGALEKLGEVKKSDNPSYQAMAQLVEANLSMEKGKRKDGIAIYKKIAADEALPAPFRNLALIRQTVAEFDEMKPQDVIDRLKPLAKPGNPWFGSAGEMTAIAHMKMGKNDLAGPIFAQIAQQESLPDSLRNRATQMAGSLGFDAVQLDEKEDEASKGDAAKDNDAAKEDSKENKDGAAEKADAQKQAAGDQDKAADEASKKAEGETK